VGIKEKIRERGKKKGTAKALVLVQEEVVEKDSKRRKGKNVIFHGQTQKRHRAGGKEGKEEEGMPKLLGVHSGRDEEINQMAFQGKAEKWTRKDKNINRRRTLSPQTKRRLEKREWGRGNYEVGGMGLPGKMSETPKRT